MPLDEELLKLPIDQKQDAENALFIDVSIDGGWSTRTYPHLLPARKLSVADNVVYYQDGLISKRPGNVLYGGGTGSLGTSTPVLSMARFYYGNPIKGHLILHSNTQLFQGNDGTGVFTDIGTNTVGSTIPCGFDQMRDPDNAGADTLFICDGAHIPQTWDGTTLRNVTTGAGFLPVDTTGANITPRFVRMWNYNLVYSGHPGDPCAVYIADALRPQRFTGYAITDTAGSNYFGYYPGGRNSALGIVTGVEIIGPYMILFLTTGIATGINTGTFGAFQYQFAIISYLVGCPAPSSIVNFGSHVKFFGGDRFYATDGINVVPLPDEIPTVYANNAQSVQPPEIKVPSTVSGLKRGRQYWAGYDNNGDGVLDSMVVFDEQAYGGWQFGAKDGGAWARWPTGMQFACGVECRNGDGDNGQLFWGSSVGDSVFQHDVGTYSDAVVGGDPQPIAMEVRAKAFFFGKPLNTKVVQGMYVLTVMPLKETEYTDTVTPYCVFDSILTEGPVIPITVRAQGSTWGSIVWGEFDWSSAATVSQQSPKGYLTGQNPQGLSVEPGVMETSTNPFNIFGFGLELTTEPVPTP